RIVTEGDLADVVEREPLKKVLEIKDSGGRVLIRRGGGGEDGEEAVGELGVDNGFDELAEGFGVELVAGDLALELPGVAVGAEDAVAEEVGERDAEGLALAVVGEVGLEDVVDDGGVAGEDLAGAEEVLDDEGGRWGVLDELGEPLVAAVLVGHGG
ncbi:hypothetical protein TIFTF001_041660, partial [Ficus carica]